MKSTRRQILAGTSTAAAAAALGARPSVSAQDPTTITWWHISTIDSDREAFQALANEFMAANPGVEIEITVTENEAFKQKMATAMQSGDPPDVFQSWGGGVLFEYADAGLVTDISEDLATDGWGDSFLPAALDLYGRDGEYYGVPWEMGMVGTWYNKALFAEAAIETPPATWDEFLGTVQTLKDAGITPLTVGEGDRWPGHFYWVYLAIRTGGKEAFDAAYTREGSFTDPPFVQAGELLEELVALEPFQAGFLGQNYNEAASAIANGNAAMEVMGHWSPSVQADEAENGEGLGEDLGFFTFPMVEGGAGLPTDVLGGGNGFGVGGNASQEAIDFVRFLTSLESQTTLAEQGVAVPPVVNGSQEVVADPNLDMVMGALAEATYLQLYYDQFLPPAVGLTVNDAVQGIFAGTMNAEEVAQMIEDSAAQELDG